MALNLNQLSKVGNLRAVAGAAASRSYYHYDAGTDAVNAVTTAGYFNDARGYLRVGDRIDLVAATGAAFRVLRVTAVAAGADVTVSALAFS